MRASVFIATSLDGFIARKNGDIDWLTGIESPGSGEDYGYKEFIGTVDALVIGRHSYEKVLTFGEWPYGDKSVVVLSSRAVSIPEKISQWVTSMSGTPAEIAARLVEQGKHHLYIDGGKTIRGFLDAGLVQQLIITRIPILLGRGIPLFGALRHDIKLRHSETRQYANGLVQSRYEVIG